MNPQLRIDSFTALGKHWQQNTEAWQAIKEKAAITNGWFEPAFIEIAVNNIIEHFLQPQILEKFCSQYSVLPETSTKKVGIVLAGNIPLVGFHDLLCAGLSGQRFVLKLSSKDDILIKYAVEFLWNYNAEWPQIIGISEMLKACDAYIATGSNNSARYFEQYFEKYPSIIRKNKTSVAILNGKETKEQLLALADDIHLYFGLGCRNVTKIFVPADYNFEALLASFEKYKFFGNHHKYKNNYDYQLAIYLLNNKYYMTNGATLLVENEFIFSAISVLHFEFYTDLQTTQTTLQNHPDLQCIVGEGFEPFGAAQTPIITQFADGVDTMQFLCKL